MIMVNRKLDEQLERLANIDAENLDHSYNLSLERASEDFIAAIGLEMNEHKSSPYNKFSFKYDKDVNEVFASISTRDDRQLFIKIDPNHIAFGFNFQIKKDVINLDLGPEFQSIQHRYFNNISIADVNDFSAIIQSSFIINRSQLSNRDFIQYAAFVLDKANSLSSEIVKQDHKNRHSKAA